MHLEKDMMFTSLNIFSAAVESHFRAEKVKTDIRYYTVLQIICYVI